MTHTLTKRHLILAILVSAGVVILLSGCKSCPEMITRISQDTVYVYLQGTIDTLTYTRTDTIRAENVRYVVRVDTAYKRIYVNGKPRIDTVIVTDTVQVVQNVIENKDVSFWDRAGYWLQGATIGFVLVLILFFVMWKLIK